MWNDEEKQKLIELYPDHTDKELCELLGKRITQLRSMKERLGLRGKHKGKVNDLSGQMIGPLYIICEAEKTSGSRNTRWLCRCTLCNSEFSVTDYWLNHSDPYGHCTCTKYKKLAGINNASYKHGGTDSTLYKRFRGMITRTENPNAWNYKHYGARGIKVCDEWRHNFDAFRSWCLEHGWNETMSVDRINNDMGYSPDNCRVIPLSEQQANRREFNPHKTT